MKDLAKVFFILCVFVSIASATFVKKLEEPFCDQRIRSYLIKDPSNSASYYGLIGDTIIIQTYKDSLWSERTLEICSLLKDSCQGGNRKVLVVDHTQNPSDWNTLYGKQLFLRQCP